jgi:lysozyme family protein
MSQQRFEESLRFVLKWEGSTFTNHPADRGGPTRYGIIQREYDAFRRRQGLPVRSVESIAMDEVRTIYRNQYWNVVEGDPAPTLIDSVLFDTGVLMGTGRAVRFLQTALGVSADGEIGPITRAALSRIAAAGGAGGLLTRILNLREARLRSIVAANPSQQVFLRGWMNRLNDLRSFVGVAAPELATAGGAEAAHTIDDEEETTSDGDGGTEGTGTGRPPDTLSDDASLMAAIPGVGLSGNFPLSPLDFLEAARARTALLGAPGVGVYVIDIATGGESGYLTAADPAASDGATFPIPLAAIESVTPLGAAPGSSATRILTAVAFLPGFETLIATFRRIGAATGVPAEFAPAQGVTTEEAEAAIDPAAPAGPGDRNDTADDMTARLLANVGAGGFFVTGDDEGAETFPPGMAEAGLLEAAESGAFPFPTLPLDFSKAAAFLQACMNSTPRVTYGLGAKVPFFGAVPGRDFRRVDCSGFVREAIRRATTPRAAFPDGSVVQHDWVKQRNFKKSTPQSALLQDGAVRIAFLRPQDVSSGIGHVVLVHNGRTLESHGGRGPNARPWTNTGWQAKSFVYVLTPPTA